MLKMSLVFLLQGLAQELSKEGACEKAIFPDTEIVVTRCDMIGNLTVEGVSKIFVVILNNHFISFLVGSIIDLSITAG